MVTKYPAPIKTPTRFQRYLIHFFQWVYNKWMCRSIKKLRSPDGFPLEEEVTAAALQYIRKVSGYRKPSRKNKAAFDLAVTEVAEATRNLLDKL